MYKSYRFTEPELRRHCSLVVEGRLDHAQQSIFPGSDPPEIAIYYEFEPAANVLAYDDVGEVISRYWPSISFWTLYDDIPNARQGRLPTDPVIAYLTTHNAGSVDRPEYILMPYPCTESIVRTDDGASFVAIEKPVTTDSLRELKAQAKLGSALSLPAIWGVAKWFYDMWAHQADIRAASDAWDTASGPLTYKLKQFVYGFGGNQYAPPTHYKLQWVDSLPPDGASGRQPLAVTVHSGGTKPTGYWLNHIKFNRSYAWTAPGTTPVPGSGQYDFISVMTHELGHALGMGHLNGNTNNVMFRSIGPEQLKRILQTDDINFISFLYG